MILRAEIPEPAGLGLRKHQRRRPAPAVARLARSRRPRPAGRRGRYFNPLAPCPGLTGTHLERADRDDFEIKLVTQPPRPGSAGPHAANLAAGRQSESGGRPGLRLLGPVRRPPSPSAGERGDVAPAQWFRVAQLGSPPNPGVPSPSLPRAEVQQAPSPSHWA